MARAAQAIPLGPGAILRPPRGRGPRAHGAAPHATGRNALHHSRCCLPLSPPCVSGAVSGQPRRRHTRRSGARLAARKAAPMWLNKLVAVRRSESGYNARRGSPSSRARDRTAAGAHRPVEGDDGIRQRGASGDSRAGGAARRPSCLTVPSRDALASHATRVPPKAGSALRRVRGPEYRRALAAGCRQPHWANEVAANVAHDNAAPPRAFCSRPFGARPISGGTSSSRDRVRHRPTIDGVPSARETSRGSTPLLRSHRARMRHAARV
jgi:hypothetical protein